MTPEMDAAAFIMRQQKPKTMGEIFEAARTMAIDDESFLSHIVDCENGKAHEVVAAHYKNLRNREYRAAAGMFFIDQ